MFAVVQHQQQLLAREPRCERGQHRPAASLAHAEHVGDGDRHAVRIVDTGEIDEPGPVAEAAHEVARDAHGQARLARATGAGERQHAAAVDGAAHVLELDIATDEARELQWQVVTHCGRAPRCGVVGEAARVVVTQAPARVCA